MVRTFTLLAGLATCFLMASAASAAVNLPGDKALGEVDFERHIMGLFGRMGCNAGSCHGSFQGKGGFRLSLFGYEPAKDLTPDNLAKYDVLLLNYKDTPKGGPETRWSDKNKKAFVDAVHGGKGLVVYHHASSAFISGSAFDKDFERVIAGGWRKQGNHGKRHVFTVAVRKADHPITKGMPAEFLHSDDELYQNSVMFPDNVVLATAYSDPNKPRGTGKDEPVIWVNQYGQGRVYENVLGHDTKAMADPNFQNWIRRGVVWAATGKAE